MKKKKPQEKLGFWRWVHKYRLKIVGISFVVIVPLVLLTAIYVGSFTNNRKIYFDAQKTEETQVISKYRKVNPEKLNFDSNFYYEISDVNGDFDLFIRWNELHIPYLNSTTGNLDFGRYRFHMYYKANDNVMINFVNVTPLLQTDWTPIRSLGTTMPIQTAPAQSNNFDISFNYRMPVRPLPLVRVDGPLLYLRVTYQVVVSGVAETKRAYIQFDLNKAFPRQVFPLT